MMYERPEGAREVDESNSEEQAARIAESQKQMEAARSKFTTLRNVTIGAEQVRGCGETVDLGSRVGAALALLPVAVGGLCRSRGAGQGQRWHRCPQIRTGGAQQCRVRGGAALVSRSNRWSPQAVLSDRPLCCRPPLKGIRSLVERLMVALEEVPRDTFRNSLIFKGPATDKPRTTVAGGAPTGRQSPGRRNAATPDRGKRAPSATLRTQSPGSVAGSAAAFDRDGAVLGSAPTTPSGAPAISGLDASTTGVDGLHGGLPGPSNTIDDEAFFPEMPELLSGLADRLGKVRAQGDAMMVLVS